jgi:isopentenyl-diphosphate Delta-isomerase
MVELVNLVDEHDNIVGSEEKFTCHRRSHDEPFGKLHRAFSLFLFSSDCSQMLLQRRASCKHTFPLRWTNSVCSHPKSDEIESEGMIGIKKAAVRRAKEELGLNIEEQNIVPVGRILYHAISCDFYAEWELDYLLFAKISDSKDVKANPEEVADIRWVNLEEVDGVTDKSPWFSKLIERKILQDLWKKFMDTQFTFDHKIVRL